jgi:hypothetical protein
MSSPHSDVTEHDQHAGQAASLPPDGARHDGDDRRDQQPGGEPPVEWPDPGTPARSALGLVVALGLLVVVLALGFVVLLVTEDDNGQVADGDPPASAGAGAGSPSESEPPADGTTVPASAQDDTERMVVAALADVVGEDYRGVVSDEEATCMAQAVVDVVGVERVPALGEPGSLSEAEEQLLHAAQAGCLDPETAARLGL